MPMGIEQNQGVVLAHWNYSRQEWNSFIRCRRLRRGRLHYILFYFFGRTDGSIPDITITAQKVWTGDNAESFSDVNRYIKRININDTGKINILEISYTILKNGIQVPEEILVPVPKGKLKEAIQVQEKLIAAAIRQ